MRNHRLHHWLLLLVLAVAASVAASFTPAARAADAHDHRKVDKRLSALADLLGGDADLHVIVLGSDAENAGKRNGQHRKRLGLVNGAAAKVKVKDLLKLAAEGGVDYVALDSPIAPQAVVDYSKLVTIYPHVDKVMSEAWANGFDGQGVGIAVIDSGVAPVSDFDGRLVQVPLAWQNGVAPSDRHGHGSLVAGIAAGKSPDGRFLGIAPGARVFALNVDRPEGTHSSDVIDALQWVFENARANNIRVVNLSLGETVASSYTQSTLDLAVERLWAAGIAVVVSAGNGGPGLVNFAPANDPLAITVGSSDVKGTKDPKDDTVASFSSGGVTVDGFAKPELLAPGRLIASVLPLGSYLDAQAPAANRIAPGYATISGTSYSAPQVAAAAALLFQKNPGWSPDQVKWTLVNRSRAVLLSTTPALAVDRAMITSSPGSANQGVPALVCAPNTTCLSGSTVASSWNSSSWNSSSWNSSSWNSSSWNSSSWNSSSWNSSSWNSSSWNSSSWNSSSWNSSSWNGSSWNSSSWD